MTKTRAVIKVPPPDAQCAIEILLNAFAADPVARWMFPDDWDYRHGWGQLLGDFCAAALASNSAYLTGDYASGAALWHPLTAKPNNEATNKLMQELVASEKLTVFARVRERMKGFEPRDQHSCWYLATIGVDPGCQGTGMGSILLGHNLAEFDKRGLSTYLHSSNSVNIPFYQKFGFELLGEIQEGDAPPLFPMYRPGRGTTSTTQPVL